MREEIEEALDEIRPQLNADGGGVELIDVTEEGVVKVNLTGACAGCPMSTLTIKNGIERVLKEKVAGVREVIAV